MVKTNVATFLRVEAVNLDSFVYDTGDLSTVRGGSLLLLDGIRKVTSTFNTKLDPVSTGASAGLFRIIDGCDPHRIRQEVQRFLREYPNLGHATWVVDVVDEDPRGFIAARERLFALNRWRQMREPSLVVPQWNSDPSCTNACSVDRRRPATAYDSVRQEYVSPPVLARRKFGRSEKQKFFSRLAPASARGMRFVNDFDELTADPGQGNLHHKMAVLFIDGNNFGKIQDDTIRTGVDPVRGQRLWDLTVKRYHQSFMRPLLQKVKGDDSWRTRAGNRYRIEVLLWGGDDILMVVPAWKGWWTLGFFFKLATGWTIGATPLIQKAGLIFCHHKAPIQRIVRLTHDLARSAKLDGKSNRAAYHVFESFDNAGGRLDHVRSFLAPQGASREGLVVGGASMLAAQDAFAAVKRFIPRRRLTMLVQALRTGDTCRAEELRAELQGILNDHPSELSRLEACFGKSSDGFLWVHLLELWDYLA